MKGNLIISFNYLVSQCNYYIAFSDLDAVIARANDTEFGLAAGVFTSDMSKV